MKKLFLFICYFFSVTVFANNTKVISPYDTMQYDQEINRIYSHLLHTGNDSLPDRIAIVSHYFLNKPYVAGPLGEGKQGRFDQNPLYRTDVFDCTTFVETTLALAKSNDLNQFKHTINKIRYRDGDVAYENRNHFVSVDWNVNNANNGYLRDMTDTFSVPAKIDETQINKPNWYHKKSLRNVKLMRPLSPLEAQNLLDQLHHNADQQQVITSRIHYLPVSELFVQQEGKWTPNKNVFNAIPSGSIIEIIRSHWDLTDKIGTYLDVSHMGFAIRTPDGLMFREASISERQVIDIPLTTYLAAYAQSPFAADIGINIEQPLKSAE